MSQTRGKSALRPRQHTALCTVCKHLKREEIERRYSLSESAPKLAEEYGVSDDSIYRHAEYFGLDELRASDTEKVLKNIIARGFAQHKEIDPKVAMTAVQELNKITGKHKAPETNPSDVRRADNRHTEFINFFLETVHARQEQNPQLSLQEVSQQIREEMRGRGLQSLIVLLPSEIESERIQ